MVDVYIINDTFYLVGHYDYIFDLYDTQVFDSLNNYFIKLFPCVISKYSDCYCGSFDFSGFSLSYDFLCNFFKGEIKNA